MVDFTQEHATAIIETRKDIEFIKKYLEDGNKCMADHERRIRFIEQTWWKICGGVIAVAAIVPWIIDYFKKGN
jgi:hypothetical protein